jgi:hypothetical protein
LSHYQKKEPQVKDLAVVGIRNMSKKTNGNSDIVFGVPKAWRSYLGIPDNYMGGDYAIARLLGDSNTQQWCIQYQKLIV